MDSRAFLGLQRTHGPAHMFAEDGTLLATASQSCAVRFWPPDQDGGPPR